MRGSIEQRGWYLTAPWDPVPIRRGDALGLRAGADYFATSSRPASATTPPTRDRSQSSPGASSGRTLRGATRAAATSLDVTTSGRGMHGYARWNFSGSRARSCRSKPPVSCGRRSVKRWLDEGRRLPNFAMSPEQFRRYRQVGTYGAYRVVLRAVPGLTTGDGWTPAETGLKLAGLVDESLPRPARLEQEHFENGTKWGRWAGEEARYWVKRGWAGSLAIGGFLPTPDNAIRKRLPEDERMLLEPAIFASASTRRVTAEVLAGAKTAKTHAELCDALAASTALSAKIEPASLASLPAFTRFADDAMHAMRGVWNAINNDDAKQSPDVEKLARSPDIHDRLDRLREAVAAWLHAPGRSTFPHEHVVTRLAQAMQAAPTTADQLRVLSRHHLEHGGGRRWFREQAGKLVPLVADTGIAATDYRFRLRPLARLAAQCGVANMNNALDALSQQEPDDEEADAL